MRIEKKLYSWSIICTLLAALLSGCGSGGRNASEALEVIIQIPEGELVELFWYGVEKKVLRIKPKEQELVDIDWAPGKSLDYALDAGDKVHFFGFDRRGRVLAEGEAEVGEEKKVSILVHRVL